VYSSSNSILCVSKYYFLGGYERSFFEEIRISPLLSRDYTWYLESAVPVSFSIRHLNNIGIYEEPDEPATNLY
jgi:hypothetical protein